MTVRTNLVRLYAFLIALNLGAWALALWAFWSHPILLGTALLAYTFGLRHAVDADHISAIDNATRKLMQAHKTPLGVGLFFSLGHSTVVVALTIAVAAGAAVMKDRLPALQHAGELIGTSVSAGFLLLIAAINLTILFDIFGAFARARRGETYEDFNLDAKLNRRGLMGRLFAPLLRIVDKSWKMYPIGVLFGLGFDTATEVALLGIAAVEAGKGLPVADILLFPLLFTAGMSLIDTTDGMLMCSSRLASAESRRPASSPISFGSTAAFGTWCGSSTTTSACSASSSSRSFWQAGPFPWHFISGSVTMI
jgi:high-affinity nickel-transport protein